MPQLARHFSSLRSSHLLPRRCVTCPCIAGINVLIGQCRSIATESSKELRYQVSHLREDVEDVEKYVKGGFHPIYLGDTFESGRYYVLHKLGFSGISTAWLARDKAKDRLVSLEVFTAEASRGQKELRLLQHLNERSGFDLRRSSIIATLGKFIVDGPNGTQPCHISQPWGPSVLNHWDDMNDFDNCRFRARLAHKIARQLARAAALLHDVGVVHGDMKLKDVLLQLRDIDTWPAETIYRQLGLPFKEEISMSSGLEPGPSAPKYLVKSASFIAVKTEYVSEQAVLVDLGKAFLEVAPPSAGVGTALSYCSPELTLESKASKASDVWALACTVFGIRSGFKLFEEDIYGDAMDASREIVENVLRTIGPPPESSHPLWEKFGIDAYTIKECQQRGYNKLFERVNDINARDRRRSLFIRDGDAAPTCYHAALQEPLGRRLSDNEEIDLGDLLRRTLKYTPENRLSANQVANHSWFTLDSEQGAGLAPPLCIWQQLLRNTPLILYPQNRDLMNMSSVSTM